MSTIYSDIQRTLESLLYNNYTLYSIAWPNTDFDFDRTELFLRPILLTSESTFISLDYLEVIPVLFQIDVFAPKNTGTNEALQLANSIIDTFFSEGDLTITNGTLAFSRASLVNRTTEAEHYITTVTIVYNCYISR